MIVLVSFQTKADIQSSESAVEQDNSDILRFESAVGHLGDGDRSKLAWLGQVRTKE